MNNSFDPYEILGVSKRFTLEELKEKYKRVAKRVHPDRGGNEKLFKLVTLAYKQLIEIFKLKQINKEFNELKSDFQEFSTNQDNQQRRNKDLKQHSNKHSNTHSNKHSNTHSNKHSKQSSSRNSQNLNRDFSDVFNSVYEENKVKDPYDNGYGNLMMESDGSRPDINIERKVKNMKNFNNEFDNAPISKNNKKIIKYNDPIALPSSSKSLKYTELGIGKIKDFSVDTNDLNCVDYKKAYSTEKLIDKRYVRARTGYNDMNGIEAERSNISYTMSDEELKNQAYLKKKEQLKELKRLERLQEMDMMNQNQFNKINDLMINYKR
tara:strand:+ start:1721 stop:2686 length:966 start_codon:yes stop_codon:yes gene_type:complete